MNVTEANILNFKDHLISNVFGNVFLFMFIGAVVVGYFCIRNRVPFSVALALQVAWFLICMGGSGFGESVVLIFIFLGIGILGGYILYKKIEGR